jgi:hypothetical protein
MGSGREQADFRQTDAPQFLLSAAAPMKAVASRMARLLVYPSRAGRQKQDRDAEDRCSDRIHFGARSTVLRP